MLGIRLLLVLIGAFLIISLLGYGISRDPRWLRFAGLGLKGGLALILLIMLVYLVERLVMVI
ncbi:MAG: hypothetical protein KKG92_10175 [Gammaproteobacteria bacterium]|nr:hypothetical protein [Gammaproteobacteria bacterium]